MHKADLATAPNKRHARYFIDTDETEFFRGTFSLAAHRLKFLCTLHEKIEVMCIIPQHSDQWADFVLQEISPLKKTIFF
jgi:hypothetical protein